MRILNIAILTVIVLVGYQLDRPPTADAAELDWKLSKQEAFAAAEQQGKKVLLIAGRDT